MSIGGWSERSLPLATILLTPWAVFQGAPDEIIKRAEEEGDDDVLTDGGNALEVSLATKVQLMKDGNRLKLEAVHPQSILSESYWLVAEGSRWV